MRRRETVTPAVYGRGVLNETDRALLDLEGEHWRYASSKQEAQRELVGSSIRAAQRLNVLLDDPQALAYAPVTVNRLRRIRARGVLRRR